MKVLKKRDLKKAVSMILAFTMLLGMVVFTSTVAAADETKSPTDIAVINETDIWTGNRAMQILWNDMQTIVDFTAANPIITLADIKPNTVFTVYYNYDTALLTPDRIAQKLGLVLRGPGIDGGLRQIFSSNGTIFFEDKFQVTYDNIVKALGQDPANININTLSVEIHHNAATDWGDLEAPVTITKVTFGEYEPAFEPELGLASEYLWDGTAADGSGRLMKDDPRVVIMDNFSDYETGRLSEHVGGRWMTGGSGVYLDETESFSGNYNLRIKAPGGSTSGGGIQQWVDTNAMKGKRMNDEEMTGYGPYGPADTPEVEIPVYDDIKHKEGGYEDLYARAMVKYPAGFNLYGHNGFGFSGGYTTRPLPSGDRPVNNPGSVAGYRSNGFDRFIAQVEPERNYRLSGIPAPGAFDIYYYGAEQFGATGNHMFGNGLVYGSTGGDDNTSLSRTDGVNGFNAHEVRPVPINEWFCLELRVKLNTVIKNGTSPGPNEWKYPFTGFGTGTTTLGPAVQPADCEILHDGVLQVWVNGEMIMDYNDVVFRYTDTMVIDNFSLATYFGSNSGADTHVSFDNVVVATEYIGPVDTTGIDPDYKDPSTLPCTCSEGNPRKDGCNCYPPEFPIRISPRTETVERGTTQQFSASLKPGDNDEFSVNLAAAVGLPGVVPAKLRQNIGYEFNVSPWHRDGSQQNSVEILFNSLHGHHYNMQDNFTPEKVVRVHFESPYDIETTKAFLKFFSFNPLADPNIDAYMLPDSANFLGPDKMVPIRRWDEVNNGYFEVYYDDYVDFLGTSDLSVNGIGAYQFAVSLYNEEGGSHVGDLPIVVTDVRLGLPYDPPTLVWSVNSDKSTISQTGLLTVSPYEELDGLTITAALESDPEIFGTAVVTVTGALEEVTIVSASVSAFVTKLDGNQNDLTITVVENLSDGETNTIVKTLKINNNAAGTYDAGIYKVYVDTKGNTQIRECYIVE